MNGNWHSAGGNPPGGAPGTIGLEAVQAENPRIVIS